MNSNKLENFEWSFGDSSGATLRCECGKLYFDCYNTGYGWEDGELENLHKTAIAIDHSIGNVCFEGKQFANVCDCWHKRANQIMAFLDGHAYEICDYFKREKARKQLAADLSPSIEL